VQIATMEIITTIKPNVTHIDIEPRQWQSI